MSIPRRPFELYPDCPCSFCTGKPLVEDPDPVKVARRMVLLNADPPYGRRKDRPR